MGEETRNVDPAVLDLGLSLGGCYTQTVPDPIPLTIRTSSSLSRDSNPNQNQIVLTDFFAEPKPPRRPTKAEMELRKVKAEQAMKRLEAKKRLVEKQRRGGFIGGGFCKEEKPPAAVAGSELANWTADSAWRHNAFRRATDQLKNNVGPSANLRIQGPEISIRSKFPTISQPTVISMPKGNGKSVLANYRSDGRSPTPGSALSTSVVMLDKMTNGKRACPETEQDRKFKKARVLPAGVPMMNGMSRLMPKVTTTGNGPNGRKIEGFLHRYLTGKVRIACICHGSFHSPADFVRHAGGGYVRNPMKHIKVLTSAF
ncbi:hypothetical protein Vadar_034226 [Vaccinium darrowii]|uniref:Uncharacterized protein n=1 Tax=Vaccinium darrowii TaxID=229202 RepID=A0ACB7YJ50_9ERIC|nr:hypothetical protein Vadar_034226 [Vaccinium darrowii]